MQIYALHGFLGLPSDWNHLEPYLNINAISLYHPDLSSPNQGLVAWAESFNCHVEKNSQPKKEFATPSKILLGYSLGGRLALHALLLKPKLWDAAIIVSAQPGGLETSEKIQRRVADEFWAMRFMKDSWSHLMADWNSQGVFASSTHLERNEKEYDRELLAESLRGWSSGTQEDLRPKIATLDLPIFWINGQHDRAYIQIAKQLILSHPRSAKSVIPNAGHRVPWDNATEFIKLMDQFIKKTGE